ncbi:MAG TPA: 7-cyano-7-deazaguanine synthase QueC [Gemmatimonadales bacterium]|nr:7-cyano-7-deazaguanine synthase QueC [Gemmatimonadales bacterium]
MPERAVVLLSGGMDSATTLAIARAEGFLCHALSFRYGQRHAVEVERAAIIARTLGAVEHRVVALDPAAFQGSALTGTGAVPKDRSDEAIAHGIPSTYVPARNTIFLAYALGIAEQLGASDIFLGINALDYSGYPDCRPEFLEAFQRMARLATRAGVERTAAVTIHAPLLTLTKREIIARGRALGVDYAQTLTCYDPTPDGLACGRCDACRLRLRGFAENGIEDPARYVGR